MLRLADIYKVYLISIAFILIHAIVFLNGFNYFHYIPAALALILIAFVRLDTYMLIIVFLTPLSIPLRELFAGLEFDMWLPTEPLLVGLVLLFFLKLIKGERLDKSIMFHPVSLFIFLNLFWILFTTVSSTMFAVSIKFFLARIWFVIPFYVVAAHIFSKKVNIKKYLWCYLIALLVVIAYAITRHASYGFMNMRAAHSVMNPFYTDHTSYGAILAMMIPVTVGFFLNNSFRPVIRVAALVILCILVAAIILSFTRAAWLSLFAAFAVLIILLLRIKFSFLAIIGIVAAIYTFNRSEDITQAIEKNRHQSSSDLSKHLQSMSNVSTDASNLERINRWNCALRMFAEKPVVGWGPGTYMFQYAPFQLTREKTLISTNASDRGNAHSEYLGPLAESGLLGMVTFLMIVIFTIYTGVKVYTNARGRNSKILAASVLLAIITYYIHGLLNNFLDTDKASALFWGITAILVAMDVRQQKKYREKNMELKELDT